MASIEIYTEQEGIIVSKEYREAKEERTFEGRIYPATPEKFIVKVVSCTAQKFSIENGMSKPVFLDYEVSKEVYAKIKFNNWMKARVGITVVSFGKEMTLKPEGLTLLQ